ncbi:MAG: Gfo/Idh/MocA family protein [Kiritimatiellia bacterium]
MANEIEEQTPDRPPIRVGIVGLGRAAFFDHLPVLRQLPALFKIVAVCDLLKERRDLVEKDVPDVRTYRQIEDMLDDPEIDLVDIALPSLEHARTALSSLARDKWTLVESPLALTTDDAAKLKAAALKTRGKLFAYTPGLFSPEFRLAREFIGNPLLGELYEVRLRGQCYRRRDDWWSVNRCGGGIAWTLGQNYLLQALMLMQTQPSQLWSELKRLVALGDAEDFAHIVLKSRASVTTDIELNGGHLGPRDPAIALRGSRGMLAIAAGASTGTFHGLPADYKFARRRSSVRTPALNEIPEELPLTTMEISRSSSGEAGPAVFWKALYGTIRTAAPFPVDLDMVLEVLRFLQIIKQSSSFAK